MVKFFIKLIVIFFLFGILNTQNQLRNLETLSSTSVTIPDIACPAGLTCSHVVLKLATGRVILLYYDGAVQLVKLVELKSDLSQVLTGPTTLGNTCTTGLAPDCYDFRAVALESNYSYDFVILMNNRGEAWLFNMNSLGSPTKAGNSIFDCSQIDEAVLIPGGKIIIKCSNSFTGFQEYKQDFTAKISSLAMPNASKLAYLSGNFLFYYKTCTGTQLTVGILNIASTLTVQSEFNTVVASCTINQILPMQFEGVNMVVIAYTNSLQPGETDPITDLYVQAIRIDTQQIITVYHAPAPFKSQFLNLDLLKVTDRKVAVLYHSGIPNAAALTYTDKYLVIDIANQQTSTMLSNIASAYDYVFRADNNLALFDASATTVYLKQDISLLITSNANGDICPLNSYFNVATFQCGSTCPEAKKFANGDRICVDKLSCTSGYVLLLNNPYTCSTVEGCPNGIYSYTPSLNAQTQCVTSCPAGTVLDAQNLTCVVSCPSDAPFYQDGKCTATCNGNYVYQDSYLGLLRCATTCPTNFKYTYAPDDMPVADKIPYIKCVTSCNINDVLLLTSCKSSCPNYSISITKICTNCKSDLQYYYKGNCVTRPPDNTILVNKDYAAYEDCPANAPLISSGTCVAKCPSGSYVYNDYKCVNLFTDKYFLNEGIAVDGCPTNKKIDSAKRECYTCEGRGMFNEKEACVAKCSDNYYLKGYDCIPCANFDFENESYLQKCVRTCSKDVNPCLNGGVCSYSGGEVRCQCGSIYVGQYCQYPYSNFALIYTNFKNSMTQLKTAIQAVKDANNTMNSTIATNINSQLVILKTIFPYMDSSVAVGVADALVDVLSTYYNYDKSLEIPDSLLFHFIDYAMIQYESLYTNTTILSTQTAKAYTLVRNLTDRVFRNYSNASATNVNFSTVHTSHFTVQVYNPLVNNTLRSLSAETEARKLNMSYIEYSDCLTTFSKENKNTSLIVKQTELYSVANNSYTVDLEFYKGYKSFNMTGYCQGKNKTFNVMIPVITDLIDMSKYKDYHIHDPPVNYYETTDSFFTDRCFTYINKTSGIEVSLTSRTQLLAPKYQINCGNCKYTDIDVGKNYIRCQCSNSTRMKMALIPFHSVVRDALNLDIFLCSERAYGHIGVNTGFYFFLAILVITFALIIFYWMYDRNSPANMEHLKEIIIADGSCIKEIQKSYLIEYISTNDFEENKFEISADQMKEKPKPGEPDNAPSNEKPNTIPYSPREDNYMIHQQNNVNDRLRICNANDFAMGGGGILSNFQVENTANVCIMENNFLEHLRKGSPEIKLEPANQSPAGVEVNVPDPDPTRIQPKKKIKLEDIIEVGLTMNDILELEIDAVLRDDKRSFEKYLFDLMYYYHPFSAVFVVRSVLKPRALRLIALFLAISLGFSLNAVFFYDVYFDEMNVYPLNGESFGFDKVISRQLSKVFYSLLVSLGIMACLKYFITPVKEYKSDFNKCIHENTQSSEINLTNIKFGSELFLWRMRFRYIVFLILTAIIYVIQWYFCIAFCAVYSVSYKPWIYSGVIAFIIQFFILQNIIFLIHAGVRQLAKKWPSSM